MTNKPVVEGFFDENTNTISYVVSDSQTSVCAIIDSVCDYNAASGEIEYNSANILIDYIKKNDLKVAWILDTHIHADHLSAASYLKNLLGGQIAVGSGVTKVQNVFSKTFNFSSEEVSGHTQEFIHLFNDNESFTIGNIDAKVMHTPGHTPACVTYVIGDAVFVGDTIFMPDFGTARCDFPGGDASQLYDSVQKILSLPLEYRMFICHDYKAPGRDEYSWETTIGEQKKSNIHVNDNIAKEAFVTIRTKRDENLAVAKLMFPSVQVNIRGGYIPDPEDNNVSYMKVPISIKS